ncbi:hypothetical protein Tco_1038888 [Tanacetum coccineum]
MFWRLLRLVDVPWLFKDGVWCVQVGGSGTGWEETSRGSGDGFLDVPLENVVAGDVTRVDGGGDGSQLLHW